MRRSTVAACLPALFVLACAGAELGSPTVSFLATIEVDQELWPLQVVAPARVTAGEEFAVTVVSYFNDVCEEAGETLVEGSGASRTVVPLDQRQPLVSVCPDSGIGTAEHVATLSFTSPGPSVVRVIGRSVRTASADDTLVVELPLVVEPR